MDIVTGHISYAHTPLNEKSNLCLHIISIYIQIIYIQIDSSNSPCFLIFIYVQFARITGVIETFAICRLCHIGHFLKKVVARLTEHDDVIKHCSEGPRALVLHWAPHLLGPALVTLTITSGDFPLGTTWSSLLSGWKSPGVSIPGV